MDPRGFRPEKVWTMREDLRAFLFAAVRLGCQGRAKQPDENPNSMREVHADFNHRLALLRLPRFLAAKNHVPLVFGVRSDVTSSI